MTFERMGICGACGKEFKMNNDRHKYCWDCKHDNVLYSNSFAIFRRDEFRCVYCGERALNGTALHLDHIVSKAHGGQFRANNLVASCSDCNLAKRTTRLKPDIEKIYLEEIKKRNEEWAIEQDVSIRLRKI